MGLWKRGSVYWAYFYIDGIRHQHSTGTSNRRQAEMILQKLKIEANARRHQLVEVDPQMTFGELTAKFLANAGGKRHHLERLQLLLPYFENVPAARITKGMVEEYRRNRKAQKTVSDATINRDVSVLRHILYWGVDECLLLANPLARVKMVRERRARRPVVSIEEEELLLDAAPEHLKRITVAALDTGMRRGEILHQLWEHVDFARRLLSVTRSKTPQGEAREIPLTQRLFDLLSAHRQDDGLIFTFRGDPIKDIKTAWKHTIERAGIRRIRFHDLRHTFNTWLMEAGVMQEVRMALMGHSNRERVHSIYTHIELPVKREAIRKLEQWITNQQPQRQGGRYAHQEESGRAVRRFHRSRSPSGGAQILEEEDASRGLSQPGGKAAPGSRAG